MSDDKQERQLLILGEPIVSLSRMGPNGPPQSGTLNLLDRERMFRYGRMFPKTSVAIPSPETLAKLGAAMHVRKKKSSENKRLPAGYTYLGQFITHDVTFDQTAGLAMGRLETAQIQSGRSPSLALDSLYGMGPLSERYRNLYDDEHQIKFKIGTTTPSRLGNAVQVYPNDLPRDASRKALIAEPRNDRNLALAQTHLAFLKFHNAVVDRLIGQGLLGMELFSTARKKVIQHYQWVILNDYLPRIIDADVLRTVLDENAKAFQKLCPEEAFLPVEFAFAAYRFGHSLVRDHYEWNQVFQSPKKGNLGPAQLHQLFTMSGGSGTMQGSPTLPSNWVIDWTRFYDFSKYASIEKPKRRNHAERIDPYLSQGLANFAGFPKELAITSPSLAILDLQMGARIGLPTGQEVAEVLQEMIQGAVLSASEIAEGDHRELLVSAGLHEQTPLWYYILKEAEVLGKGERLGPIGSWIVGQTLIGLIAKSEYSILKEEGWKPDLGPINPEKFGMTDLLLIAGEINPLGARADATTV